jgi:hypothetical protein
MLLIEWFLGVRYFRGTKQDTVVFVKIWKLSEASQANELNETRCSIIHGSSVFNDRCSYSALRKQ